MLTTNDLQQIRGVVHEEVKPIKDSVSKLQKDVTGLKEDMTEVKKDIRKIKNGQDTIINFFDHTYLELDKRVTRVERHLQFPTII